MENEDIKKLEEFEKIVNPLIKYLKENYNPHISIIIDDNGARLVEDILGIPNYFYKEV